MSQSSRATVKGAMKDSFSDETRWNYEQAVGFLPENYKQKWTHDKIDKTHTRWLRAQMLSLVVDKRSGK